MKTSAPTGDVRRGRFIAAPTARGLKGTVTMPVIPDNCPTVKTAQVIRAELAYLQARYDDGAIPQAVFAVIRELETELGWLEHRGRP